MNQGRPRHIRLDAQYSGALRALTSLNVSLEEGATISWVTVTG